MFLLNREIAEAFKANTEAREAFTEALKKTLKHTEDNTDGRTEA